jgi:hypothetical protein
VAAGALKLGADFNELAAASGTNGTRGLALLGFGVFGCRVHSGSLAAERRKKQNSDMQFAL